MQNFEQFAADVNTLVSTLQAYANGGEALAKSVGRRGFPDFDYSVHACEAAHQITGYDRGFCLLFNRQHRAAAVQYGFTQAA